jgi:predicted DNA-binding transcriptional regulator AlpA
MDIDRLLLRISDIERIAALSRSGIYRLLIEDETFPRPVRLKGTRTLFWRLSDISEWIETLKPNEAESSQGAKK